MTRASTQAKLVKLDFQEKLIQSGKKENTEALLKRLKSLHQKLASLEQDAVDVTSLETIKKPLIEHKMLLNKDRGVRAYTACCLADLLRLYAPDAPYEAEELRDIFQFYITQLKSNLKPPTNQIRPLQPSRTKSNEPSQSQSQSQSQASQRVTDVPYYNEYCYLLESLATIKSVVLACDVPGGDDIVADFYNGFVEMVRPDMSKNVIRHMTDILVWLMEESGTVPTAAFNCVLDQLENTSTKSGTPAFQMIVDVCNRSAERLQRPLLTLKHGRHPEQADQEILAKSHSLLVNMYRNCPGTLMLVVPLLEENLRAADQSFLREISTKILGTMFGERPTIGGGRADLARAYPTTWRAWLGRKVDKSIHVRLAWVAAGRGILINHPELRASLEIELIDRIEDSDERVRAAICKVIGSLDYEAALHHVSVSTLEAIGGRISDKKGIVRQEAATALARLWSLAYAEISADDQKAIEHFAWIPQTMLAALAKGDATVELRTQITLIFKSIILPLPNVKDVDEQSWTDRLLLIASHLDETAFRSLERLTGLLGYAKGSSPYRAFIDVCEANNGGIIDQDENIVKARLEFVINAIAKILFVEPDKAKKDMQTFADANEQRLYKLFKACVDVQSDLRTIIKARNELSRRLEQSHAEVLGTFTTIVDSASWNIVNHSSIPGLISALQRPATSGSGRNEKLAEAARRFMVLISKEGAPMVRPHVSELALVMGDKRNERLSTTALQALAAIAKADPEHAPSEERIIDRATRMAKDGTVKQAKFATRLLAFSSNVETCSKLVEDALATIDIEDQATLLSRLSVLSEMAVAAPSAFEAHSEEIMGFLHQEVLPRSSPSREDVNGEPDWVEETELEVHDVAKLFALRIVTNRALSQSRGEDAVAIVQPVLGLLGAILASEGFTGEGADEGSKARCHLRYRAAACMLKLAKVKAFDKLMKSKFETIATISSDPCPEVRLRFMKKLRDILPSQRLSPRWNLVPALSAQDPQLETVQVARSVIISNVKSCVAMSTEDRIDRIELPLARLLLVVSHLPTLNWNDVTDLLYGSKYIEMYLDCVMMKENVALLFHIAHKLKTVRDANTPNISAEERKKMHDENRLSEDPNATLYKLSELTTQIIKQKAKFHQWAVHNYPGKVKFPHDIFHNLTDLESSKIVLKHEYLDPDFWNKNMSKRGGPAISKRLVTERASPVKKRPRSVNRNENGKKRVRRREVEDDDDDEEDEEDEASEDEDVEDEGDDDGDDDETGDEEEDEDSEGEMIFGRGGKRGAKTKARKAARKSMKKKLKVSAKPISTSSTAKSS